MIEKTFRKAILHNYIPWNDGDFDITKLVKVVAEVNYYNGDKGYLCTSYDHNARLQRVHKNYIEFLEEE